MLPNAKNLPAYLEVKSELGSGTDAQVLLVHDRVRGLDCALKLGRKASQKAQLRAEYGFLSQLRHPNIVGALDLGATNDGLTWFTMERMSGLSFAEFAKFATVAEIATVAAGLLDALVTIHGRGWTHRDIKPANVVVKGGGVGQIVKLLDFSLLTDTGDGCAGTLPYVAPETITQCRCTPLSDLYSLGMMVYEALVPGVVPAEHRELGALLRTGLPSPTEVDPRIPQQLSALVMRLLQPEPTSRYQSAQNVLQDLGEIVELHLSVPTLPGVWRRMLKVGAISHRETELGTLLEQARNVRSSGRGTTQMIIAPRGYGKTPLMRELRARLNFQGIRALATTTTMEPGFPIPELSRWSAVLSGIGNVTKAGSNSISPKELQRSARVCATELGRGIVTEPCAILIDDFQKAGSWAQEVLAILSRECAEKPLFLCIATEDELGNNGIDPQPLRLPPLDAQQISDLVVHRLGGLRLPDIAATRLARDSGGMPGVTQRLLLRMLDNGQLEPRTNGGFDFRGGRYETAHDVGVTFADVTAASRAADGAAAVCAYSRAVDYLERGLGYLDEAHDGPQIAAFARRLGELEEAMGSLVLAERWYLRAAGLKSLADRDAITNGTNNPIPIAEQARALLGLAHIFLTKGRQDDCRRWTDATRAILKQESGEHIDALLARAHQYDGAIALKLGKPQIAEEQFLHALGLCGDDNETKVEVLLGLSKVASQRGVLGASARYGRQALGVARTLGRAASAAEALAAVARALMRTGRYDGAATALHSALRLLGSSGDNLVQVAVLREHGNLEFRRGDFERARKFYEHGLERARALDDVASESACLHNVGLVRALCGDFRGALMALESALEGAQRIGDKEAMARSLAELGGTLARAGAPDRARDNLDLASKLAAGLEDEALIIEIELLRTWAQWRGEDRSHGFSEVSDMIRKRMPEISKLTEQNARTDLLDLSAECALAIGDVTLAAEAIGALREAVDSSILCYQAQSELLFAELELLHGNFETARKSAYKAAQTANKQGLKPMEVTALHIAGALEKDPQKSLEMLTTAMEKLRDLHSGMPKDLRSSLLELPANRRLQLSFQNRWTQTK